MSFPTFLRSQEGSLLTGIMTLVLAFAGHGAAQTSLPAPTSGKFVFPFQSSEDPTYQTFVVPLDFQTGVQMNPMSNIPWQGSQSLQFGTKYMLSVPSTGTPNYTQSVNSPVAYFGSAVGASQMYEETSYRFALYAGDGATNVEGSSQNWVGTSGVYVYAYAKSDVNAGNIQPTLTSFIPLPHPTAAAAHPETSVTATTVAGSANITVSSTSGMVQNESIKGPGIPTGAMIVYVNSSTSLTISAPATSSGTNVSLIVGGWGAWTAFGDNGFQASLSLNVTNGTGTTSILDTMVQIVMAADSSGKWGDDNKLSGPLLITHKAHAGAEQYYFQVFSVGFVQKGNNYYYMTSSSSDGLQPTATKGYAMNFDKQSPWTSKLLTMPSFQGTPMPAAYYGKSATEIENQAAPVELLNLPAPTTGQFANVGTTPELQPHSVLDQFVAQMGNNPVALAAYVQNQIGLTDALAYNNQGDLNEASVNAGGMERAAAGTFLEGQGSPEEQCALLVYLLRKAGYQAAYVLPPHNSLQLADQRMSNLLRMRIAGAMSPEGTHPVPQFISCNYPFVAAYLPSGGTSGMPQWVPLFPWLKDTDVEQGLNVNNYLPNGATDIRQWVRNFLLAKSDSAIWNSDSSPITSSIVSCSTTAGSAVVTVTSARGLMTGQTVTGPGIPAGALVASVNDPSGTTLTCSTTGGSASVTVPIGTTGLVVGQAVSGAGIPSNTTIYAINSSTTLTLSANATATNGGAGLTFAIPPATSTLLCYITAGSSTVTMYPYYSVTTAGLSAGMSVSGLGIPAGTTVTTVNSSTTLTLSANATASYNTVFSPIYLTFTAPSAVKPTVTLTKNATATASSAALTFQSWDRTPGGFFLTALADNLQKNYPGISLADLGVSFLNRKYHYTNWGQFPQPIPVKPTVSQQGATVSGSNNVTVTSATGLVTGLAVAGPGIPAGTTLTAINGTTLTLSNPATVSSSGNVSLAFGTRYVPAETLTGDTSLPVATDRELYDTVDITIKSDQNPSKAMTLSGVRVMDLHNRRAIINFQPLAMPAAGQDSTYNMTFTLAPYDMTSSTDTSALNSGTNSAPGTTFTYGASGDPFMRHAQRQSMTVTSADQNYSLTVVYHRNRSYKGAANVPDASLGGWSHFLGIKEDDFTPNGIPIVSTTTAGSTTVSIPGGAINMFTGMRVAGPGIPADTFIATIPSGSSITSYTLTKAATASGTVALSYEGGSGSSPPVVSHFFLGDLNAFCVNTGRVSSGMVDLHVQYYNQLQQQIQASSGTIPIETLDTMEGSLAYLMGMTYYQRMSSSMGSLKNLFQVNTLSTRAHGFGQLGAQKLKNASGTLVGDSVGRVLPQVIIPVNTPAGTLRISHTFPKVDMNFILDVSMAYSDLRADAGGQGILTTPDFYYSLMGAHLSSLESETIAKFFPDQNTDAVSTANLLQRVQLGLNGATNPDIIELTSKNYATLGSTNYTVNGVTKALSDWAGGATNAGSMWMSVAAAFSAWDGDQVRVYLTPGNVTGAKGQWQGMGALIMGRIHVWALISSFNSINGGAGGNVYALLDVGVEEEMKPIVIEAELTRKADVRMSSSYQIDRQSILNAALFPGEPGYDEYVQVTQNSSRSGSGNAPAANPSQAPATNRQTQNYSNSPPTTSLYEPPPETQFYSTVIGGAITWGTVTLQNILPGMSSGSGNLTSIPPGGVTTTSPPNGPATPGSNAVNSVITGTPLAVGDPVNTLTGELTADETDLLLPGPISLQIRRSYSSRNLASGEFGYGWKPAMFPYLVLSTNSSGVSKIQAAEMDGTVITYTQASGSTTSWIVTAADNPLLGNGSGMSIGSVHNPYNNTVTLTGSSGTNGATYTLKGADGSVRVYTVNSYPLGSVTRQRPYLTSWTDSVGNSLTFNYYGDGSSTTPKPWYGVANTDPAYGQLAWVQASNGNSVSFTYDAYGHIVNIASADGRQLNYSYDGNGDLREVAFPDGSWTQYDYLIQVGKVGTSTTSAQYSTHLISQETRPNGRRVQTNYVKFQAGDLDEVGGGVDPSRIGNDVSTARRVDYQMATVGQGDSNDATKAVGNSLALVKNAQYYYYLTTDASGNINGRTEIVDAYNRKTIYYFINSRLVQIMDPLSTVTDVTTGAGTNPKMVQTWYTALDVTNNVPGAWAGGLSSIYHRGGTLTTFQYSTTGDVVQTSVSGYLDGTSGPSNTVISVAQNATAGQGPVLSGFVSYNTAVTTATYSTDGRHLPLTVTHPNPTTGAASGRCTVFTYDSARPYYVAQVAEYDSPALTNLLNSSTTTYQDVTSGSIFAKGLPQVVTVAPGTADAATTTWSYNANGLPTQKISASGQSQTTNPDSVVEFSFDLRGQLIREQVMAGTTAAKTNLYSYDEMGRPIWVERRDASGKQVGWNYIYYNLNGEVEWTQGSRLEPADYTYSTYDGAGRPVEKTSWRSRAKADGSGVEAVPGAAVYATSIYSYNMFGDLLGITDALGNSIKASYDAIGRRTGTTAYQGNWQDGSTSVLATTSTSYDDIGLSVTSTDACGGVTQVYGTSTGRPRLRVNADGTQLTWLYYLDGRIKRQPISATTYVDFAYDDVTRTVTKTTKNTTNSETFTETATLDRRGNVTSATDVASFTTTATYDALNRPMTAVIPAAGSTSAARSLTHAYDAAGFMHKIIDAAGEVTEADYDALGRMTTTKTGNGTTVTSQSSVSYSSDFQSVTTTSGTGAGAISETVWTDLEGRTVLVKHADGSFASASYDAVGNVLASSDETGQTTTNTYDGLQRLLTSTLPDGATTQFVYAYPSGGGQTVERRMPGGLTEFVSADALGRPVESYLKGAGNALTRHYTNYAYYTSGKEQGLLQSYTDPNGYSHAVTYDAWLRPATSSAGTSGTAAYVFREILAYDPRGMVTQVRETTFTGVSQIDRSFDGQGHLYDEKVSLGSSSATLAVVTDLAASYDNAGRRASLARGSAVSALGDAGGSWAFQYRADGMLSEVDVAGGAFTYTYGDNGLLQSRVNPFRSFSISGRDARGRILQTATQLISGGTTASTNVVSENISSWSFDDKQLGYSCWHQSSDLPGTPAAWTDSRSYTYSTQRRKLATETWTNSPDKTALNTNISATQTLTYTFDGGAAAGLGVRTNATTTTAGTAQQHQISAQDAWARVTGESGGFEKRLPFAVQGNARGAASVDLRVGPKASLSQVSFPDATVMTTGAWSRGLSLPAGSYALNAIASHPSGLFSNQTSSSFSLAVHNCGVSETYDYAGNVTTRTVTDGAYTRAQALGWDAEGRLMSVTQTDNSPGGHAFVWRATYDAGDRRVQTQTQFTGGSPQADRTVSETSWHDPLVEFLEVGLEVTWSTTSTGTVTTHERWWKVHGPDLDGGYGGLQGMGGLEAMVNESTGEAVGFIDDVYGHILGFAAAPGSNGGATSLAFQTPTATFEWNVGRFGGYGPLPGHWSPAIADSVAPWRTFGWRGKRTDVTGYYHLGARDYDSNGGRFLSADPFGHAASMSLYDYADGDPINFVDPQGRSAGSSGTVTSSQAALLGAAVISGSRSTGGTSSVAQLFRNLNTISLPQTGIPPSSPPSTVMPTTVSGAANTIAVASVVISMAYNGESAILTDSFLQRMEAMRNPVSPQVERPPTTLRGGAEMWSVNPQPENWEINPSSKTPSSNTPKVNYGWAFTRDVNEDNDVFDELYQYRLDVERYGVIRARQNLVARMSTGLRMVPDSGKVWESYQKFVTGQKYEDMWKIDGRVIAADAFLAGYFVEAKWTGGSDAQFPGSPYHPNNAFYDEVKILSQAEGYLKLNNAIGANGVRYAFSNQAAATYYRRLFSANFGEAMRNGTLQVWHVPANGMKR